MNALLTLCAVLLAAAHTEAFPGGAPTDQCMAMAPSVGQHGAGPQTGAAPYNIAYTWMADMMKYMVMVEPNPAGTALPRGIMMQARKPGMTTPWGTFTLIEANPTQLLMCTAAGDTVTHTAAARTSGSNFGVYWAPPQGEAGAVEFVATIVQTQNTYWVQHKSAEITVTAAPPTMAPTMAPTAQATEPSTAAAEGDTTTPGGSTATVASGVLTAAILLLVKFLH